MFKVNYIKKFYIKIRLVFFLLKLLFSTKDKIRYRLFDSTYIKKFLEDDGWDRILNIKRKNISKISIKNSNIFETAILLPGRLRDWNLSKDLIYSLANRSKIFIMTDRTDKEIIDNINHVNIYKTIIEDSEYRYEYANMPNIVFSQYLKLRSAIKEVYKYEKKYFFSFKNFIKLRTDYFYLNPDQLLNMSHENNEECLFSQSDLNFSGRREFFLPLQNYYEFAEWSYFNNFHNLQYIPVNPYQIIKSDPGATKYNWLMFPKEIIGKTKTTKPSGEYIKNMINKNFKTSLKYKFKVNNKMKETAGNGFFPSESSFALFLNLIGIVCKTHTKFIGHIIPNQKENEHGLKDGVLEYRDDMKNLK